MKIIKNKNIRNLIGIAVVLFMITVVLILFFEFFRINPDTRKIKTHKSLTSKELFAELKSTSTEDLTEYIEKAVEVEGVIKELNHRNDLYTILLEGDEYERYIICEMQSDQNAEILKLNIGEKITIKGIFKGFLMDAILLNCILEQ